MATNLVLQSFGREGEYKRAILTILSYYAQTSVTVANTRTVLFTDKPGYFEGYLQGLPVSYVTLTPEKIKEMRGAIDFLHRMKIAVIEEAFRLTEGNMLYADSDTFFIADPTPLERQLTSGRSFMHELEYAFKDAPDGPTFSGFLRLITSQDFVLSDGQKMKVTPEDESWNAGVMFFHPDHARFIPDVYALTDQFFPSTQNHASEQYAFSLMLKKHTALQPCDSVIYHYWYRVKKQIMDQFLKDRFNAEWSKKPLAEKLGIVKEWTVMLPGLFTEHEWTIQDHAVQAFNQDKFGLGYKWAAKAILKKPLRSGLFLKDVFYHMKRQLTHK